MHLLLIIVLFWLLFRPRRAPNPVGCLFVLLLFGALMTLLLIADIIHKLMMFWVFLLH
jgi:hypothetical protein